MNALVEALKRAVELEKEPARRPPLMRRHLAKMRKINHEQDDGPIRRMLIETPGPWGAGAVDTDLRVFAEEGPGYLERLGSWDGPPGRGGLSDRFIHRGPDAGRPDAFEFDQDEADDREWFTLARAQVASGATTDSETIDLKGVYENAELWLETGDGQITWVTALTVGKTPYDFGEAEYFPAQFADPYLEFNRLREGIYIGTLRESLTISVELRTAPSANLDYVIGVLAHDVTNEGSGFRGKTRRRRRRRRLFNNGA